MGPAFGSHRRGCVASGRFQALPVLKREAQSCEATQSIVNCADGAVAAAGDLSDGEMTDVIEQEDIQQRRRMLRRGGVNPDGEVGEGRPDCRRIMERVC